MARKPKDEEALAKKLRAQVAKNMGKGLEECENFLLDVITGVEKDTRFDQKSGQFVEGDLPVSIRLEAIRTYGKIFVDKVVPDRREFMKQGVDEDSFASEIEAVAKAVREEQKLAAGGEGRKVVPMPDRGGK